MVRDSADGRTVIGENESEILKMLGSLPKGDNA